MQASISLRAKSSAYQIKHSWLTKEVRGKEKKGVCKESNVLQNQNNLKISKVLEKIGRAVKQKISCEGY